ncbi:unnamed protein product [Heterosigma akashiwo]
MELLMKNKTLFQSSKPGKTPYIVHRINSKGTCYVRPYRLAATEIDKAEAICEEMLKDGIIKPSNSAFNNPVVMVTKKDQTSRFCLDLKRLNSLCAATSYPLDSIADCMDSLGGGVHYLSSVDIIAAFWNIEVDPEDQHKLAFSVRSKKYEFTRVPFGLKDSSYTFVMLMNKVLGDSKWMHSMCYIDDVVVFTKKKDFGLHLQHLQDVFTRLQRANLRLKAAKCEFATGEISFLGYRVGREGLKPCPKKIEAIAQIAVPRTKKQVRSFLGLAGFYRNMIKMFSVTAEPLHGLTKAKNPERVRWTPECQKAFEALKEALTSHPVLQLPDMFLPFILETDASKMGIGAVLMQELEPGKMCAIAYASRLNSPAQKNYSVFDLELSAIVYGVTRFRPYLYGRTFTIVSDHKALRHLMSLTQPGDRLARWQLMLADYTSDYLIGGT